MSYRTTADDHLELAREAVRKAIEELSEIVINEAAGHDKYMPALRAKIKDSLSGLISIRDDLR